MQLKQYQTHTLDTLRRFFEQARLAGPKAAYEAIATESEQAARIGRYAGAYAPLAKLPDVPYVCLRLPTGGGKTLLAAHSSRLHVMPGWRRTIPWSCGWCRPTRFASRLPRR